MRFFRSFCIGICIGILCIVGGMLVYPYGLPLPDAQISIQDYPPITIQANNTLSTASYQTALHNFQTQPEYLRQYCQGLILMDQETLEETYGEKMEEDFTLMAYSRTPSNVIYMSDFSSKTISHELWHIYDKSNEIVANSGISSFFEKYREDLGDYASQNETEWFAEAGSWYVNCPEKMKEKMPEVYSYFENLQKEAESL